MRHGHLRERAVMTGIGAVKVRQPRMRDRDPGAGAGDERIKFTFDSAALRPAVEELGSAASDPLPEWGFDGDFAEALAALVGKDAPGLSPSTIVRLKDIWAEEHKGWEKRDLSAKRYVYVWADGIHLQVLLEDDAQCILVLIGATKEDNKELIGFTGGIREAIAPLHDWAERWARTKR